MITEYLASLSHLETLFLVGVTGALVLLPLKDVISFEFYDICDVFLSLMIAAIVFAARGIDEPSPENILIVMGIISIGIMFIKVFVIVPFQKKGENSTVLSMQDYVGMTGTLSVSVTKASIGEVIISTPFGIRNQMAKIEENEETKTLAKIPAGADVCIVRVAESILYVVPVLGATINGVITPITTKKEDDK